jgi:PHP family Zn ribbon phosphoesterase
MEISRNGVVIHPVSRRKRASSSRTAAANSTNSGQTTNKPQRRWYKADLHIHTPASSDFEEPNATYLECLRTAAEKGMEIIAITDHNTIAGVAAMRREVEWLIRLERENRLNEAEHAHLQEWRELSNKVLVLPGVEFTATFGFHILGIFSPQTSIRQLEHVLLLLKVPEEKLDAGSTETGASTDVLNTYRIIREAGGLVIAAHANSTHGVAMRNFPFGGQTKIAYTQDASLDALEVTDLDQGSHSMARFFNGSKAEYPRRMHCIQSSDAHRLVVDPKNPKRLGIGDRSTEFLLDEPSYEALCVVLRSNQFERTRPARPKDKPFDALAAAREEGASIVQSFHESAQQRGGKLDAILSDVCAFANTAGGVIYIGAGARKDNTPGLSRPKQVEEQIRSALEARLTPLLEIKSELVQGEGASILRLRVPKGGDRPYCLDGNKFYLRDETETYLAVRDEIVALVRETLQESIAHVTPASAATTSGEAPAAESEVSGERAVNEDASTALAAPGIPAAPVAAASPQDAFYLPQVGVEIVDTQVRNGNKFHSIRDLRNSTVIHNVSRKGARHLWNYAIQQHEDSRVNLAQVEWRGNIGLARAEKRAGKVRYDLALREGDTIRVFYGVTEDGMEGPWAIFLQDE